MATLKDIAALAGVNTSTVSKALRGSNDIKAETCTRIRALADELGYVYWHPKQPTVSTVGVVFPRAVQSILLRYPESLSPADAGKRSAHAGGADRI